MSAIQELNIQKGSLESFALHAQCSLWNDQCDDRIYLKQECVMELVQAGTYTYLSVQLSEEKIKHVKLIFVPVFYERHCFLVVANFHKKNFDYLDSLISSTSFECAHKITGNLKKYLGKCGINTYSWALSIVHVQNQNNIYDCGYRLMLHMIHYGKDLVLRIDEDMAFRYRMEFAVNLINNPANMAIINTDIQSLQAESSKEHGHARAESFVGENAIIHHSEEESDHDNGMTSIHFLPSSCSVPPLANAEVVREEELNKKLKGKHRKQKTQVAAKTKVPNPKLTISKAESFAGENEETKKKAAASKKKAADDGKNAADDGRVPTRRSLRHVQRKDYSNIANGED